MTLRPAFLAFSLSAAFALGLPAQAGPRDATSGGWGVASTAGGTPDGIRALRPGGYGVASTASGTPEG